MNSNDIRKKFFDYFKTQQHTLVPSCSLIPPNDRTLLFTNAGMVQFKDVFLGKEKRDYTRAVSSQRCVRAGGKHNDLENVGHTARHHTFFEMLGNFSFGDYFKKEAIELAWDFLTNELKIPKEKLWVSVYKDDHESADIWKEVIGFPADRISYCDEDNFWMMGDTGPCGPCTEIFYDHGPELEGGPPGTPDEDGDRYVEVWNLVFMQYDRTADGKLNPLPKPSVDTGMGLERLAAVQQGVHNNYDTDLFTGLIEAAAKLGDIKDLTLPSLRVIADHIRSTAFLITDGIVPSNEGRGYVLRRIMRRAIRHGVMLGLPQPFFYKLVPALVQQMGEAYPELKKEQKHIETVIKREEALFEKTVSQGLKLLEQEIDQLTGDVIPGDIVFKLYDTYGFPADLTADIARDKELKIDEEGFNACMQAQKEKARSASSFGSDYSSQARLAELLKACDTVFTGYDDVAHDAKVIALIHEDELVDTLHDKGIVVLDRTPFYAESGGQVGDEGIISSGDNQFKVLNTTSLGDIILHHVECVEGQLNKGDEVHAAINEARRQATVLNHSATHLLHHALRTHIGEHVVQKGSLVAPDRLRFDFSHFAPLTAEEIATVENAVNAEIRANHQAVISIMEPEAAKSYGALALFGEKYGDEVRVLRFGESKELCGGTHAERTGDVGLFKIISESGIAAGIRRIESVTGQGALDWLTAQDKERDAQQAQMQQKIKTLEKQIQQLQAKIATNVGGDLAGDAKEIAGVKVLAKKLDHVNPKSLRDTLDQLKNKLKSAVVVLAVSSDQSVNLVAGVTKDNVDLINAKDLVNMVAEQVGGKGGGRPDMAQAGGSSPEHLDKALDSVYTWVSQKLNQS
ncbi:MAG: alanine--tRNA ligase [Gammaproteobacteria bacterium]